MRACASRSRLRAIPLVLTRITLGLRHRFCPVDLGAADGSHAVSAGFQSDRPRGFSPTSRNAGSTGSDRTGDGTSYESRPILRRASDRTSAGDGAAGASRRPAFKARRRLIERSRRHDFPVRTVSIVMKGLS
jgi:hypothetical protein